MNDRQARGVLIIDTAKSKDGDVGLVAVIPVGMAQISSVVMSPISGTDVEKGTEFGHFLFGGSDIIVLFQSAAAADIFKPKNYLHYGKSIAKLNHSNLP